MEYMQMFVKISSIATGSETAVELPTYTYSSPENTCRLFQGVARCLSQTLHFSDNNQLTASL